MAAYEFLLCDPNVAAVDRSIRTAGPAVGDVVCTTSGGVAGHPVAVSIEIPESSTSSGLGQLLAMTPDDALIYSSGIAFVWAIAWGIRVAVRSLNVGDVNEEDR